MILALLLLLSSLAANASPSVYQFDSDAKQQQFQRLTQELRCLVCQNQTIADSAAGLADDLKQEIYEKVQQGQSDQEIKNYFVARYGEFILFKPSLHQQTLLLWFGPLLILLTGIIIFTRVVKTQRQT